MSLTRAFSPAKKITPEEDTIGRRLARLARASLPHVGGETGTRRPRAFQYCFCGEQLHKNAKVRQGEQVCDECAKIVPRSPGGRRPNVKK